MAETSKWELAAKPWLQRFFDAVAMAIGDSAFVERYMGQVPHGVRIAIDGALATAGSMWQPFTSHLANDVLDTFTNRLAERLRVQTRGTVTSKDVEADFRAAVHEIEKKKEAIMAELDKLEVYQVEGESFFRIEGCPTMPAAPSGARRGAAPSGNRRNKMTLERAEKALGLPLHPGCAECLKILDYEKKKAADAAKKLDDKLAAATAPAPKTRSVWEWIAELPAAEQDWVTRAVQDNLDLYYPPGPEREAAEVLLNLHVTSTAEVLAFARAPNRAKCDIVLHTIKGHTPTEVMKAAVKNVKAAVLEIKAAFAPAAPAAPPAPPAPAGAGAPPGAPAAPANPLMQGAENWRKVRKGLFGI